MIAEVLTQSIPDLKTQLFEQATISFPQDAQFNTKRWSDFGKPNPGAIINVATEDDICSTIKWANKYNIPFLAQSGGHGFHSSLSKLSKSGIVINLNAISSIVFDKEAKTATLGGGVLTGDALNAAHANGVHIMTGVCNTVGLIPAIIGGGLGNMMGMCGIGVDNMLSATVITASGDKIKVSKDENSELWWGLRGAGGNFGVVSSLTVKSYEQVNGGIFCSGSIGFVGKTVDEIGEIARTLEKLEIGRKMAIGFLWARIPPSFQPTFIIHLFYAGPEDEATKAFEPLFALKPTFAEFAPTPYNLTNAPSDPAGVKGGRRPTWGIGMKRFDGARIKEAWKIWEDFTGECTGAMASLVIGDYYNHDKTNEVDEGDTAYPWRKVGVHLLFSGNYQDPSLDDEVSVVGRKFRDSLKTEGESFSVYVNFAHGDEKLEEIYGSKERIERLGKLKKKWDPERRFGFTFPIPLQ